MARWPGPLAFVQLLFADYVLDRDKARELSRHGVGTGKFLRLLWVLYRDQLAVIRDKKDIQRRKVIREQRRQGMETDAESPGSGAPRP